MRIYTEASVTYTDHEGRSVSVSAVGGASTLVTIEIDDAPLLTMNGGDLVDAIYSVVPAYLTPRSGSR